MRKGWLIDEQRILPAVAAQPCFRDPKVAMFGLENVLFGFGGHFIEIVAPTRPDTAAGRFMARRTPHGAYMCIFDCHDLAAARARIADARVRIVFEAEEENGAGVQLHPADVGCGILEIDQHAGGEDLMGRYSWAGHDWQRHALPQGQGAIGTVELVSPAAEERAALWAQLIGCGVEQKDAETWRLRLDCGDVVFAQSQPGAAERIAAITMRVPDIDRTLAVAHEHGLDTDGCGFAFLQTEFRLAAISG